MNASKITITGDGHTPSISDRIKPFFRQDAKTMDFFKEMEKRDVKSFAELRALALELSKKRHMP